MTPDKGQTTTTYCSQIKLTQSSSAFSKLLLPINPLSKPFAIENNDFLLIEVAKTSLRKDLDLKASIYAVAEIQEY
ncbi:MAG: Uma2 family endonuclease [Hydrococcus sp. Prado102]|nr:Uma2 family endonuclease [Hydrococcus sp. Prado102]